MYFTTSVKANQTEISPRIEFSASAVELNRLQFYVRQFTIGCKLFSPNIGRIV